MSGAVTFATISLWFVQQPKNVYRMRYSKEKRFPILRAQNDNFQYPKIKIFDPTGCSGVLYLTCCNAEESKPNGYAVHPNKLHEWNTKQKQALQTGVLQIPFRFNPGETEIEIELANLYIEHVCAKDVNEIISNVKQVTTTFDPFNMGVQENGKYDFDKIRLCCQVVSSDARMSEPLVSDVIKQNSFEIVRTVHNHGTVTGGDEMVLFINNLPKFKKTKNEEEQLIVRFYEEVSAWTKEVLIDKKEIHHSCALVVPAPPYYDTEILTNKEVKFNFYKEQNGLYEAIESEDNTFVYTPIKTSNKRSNENASLPDYRCSDDENEHRCSVKRQKSVHVSNSSNESSILIDSQNMSSNTCTTTQEAQTIQTPIQYSTVESNSYNTSYNFDMQTNHSQLISYTQTSCNNSNIYQMQTNLHQPLDNSSVLLPYNNISNEQNLNDENIDFNQLLETLSQTTNTNNQAQLQTQSHVSSYISTYNYGDSTNIQNNFNDDIFNVDDLINDDQQIQNEQT